MIRSPALLVVVLLAVVGAAAIMISTRLGIGISTDSAIYIGSARNLLQGNGLITPFGKEQGDPFFWYPPFYPLMLTFLSLLLIDPTLSARWMSVFLFSINLLLYGFLLFSIENSGGKKLFWLPIVGVFFMLLALPMLEIHMMAWSEALFLLLMFLLFGTLDRYFKNQKFGLLVLSAILAGLATIARYVGVTLIITGVISLLVFSKRNYINKFLEISLFLVISLLPVTLWMIRNRFLIGTFTGREFSIHIIGRTHVSSLMNTLATWFLIPDKSLPIFKLLPLFIGIVFFVYILLAKYWGKYKMIEIIKYFELNQLPLLITISLIFISVYLIFLLVSISFFDFSTPLDNRILSPIFPALLMVILYSLYAFLLQMKAFVNVPQLLIMIGFLFSILWLQKGINLIVKSNQTGIGYNSISWSQSGIVSDLKKLPDDLPIYTNAPAAIYIHTNRSAYPLPRKYLKLLKESDRGSDTSLRNLEVKLKENPGMIVYFNILDTTTILSEGELQEAMPYIIISP